MVDSIEPGDVTRFNRMVDAPGAQRLTTQSEISDYMESEMGGFLSDNAIREFSKRIAEIRQQEYETGGGFPDIDEPDAVYDPQTNRWRNPETGAFVESPDSGFGDDE